MAFELQNSVFLRHVILMCNKSYVRKQFLNRNDYAFSFWKHSFKGNMWPWSLNINLGLAHQSSNRCDIHVYFTKIILKSIHKVTKCTANEKLSFEAYTWRWAAVLVWGAACRLIFDTHLRSWHLSYKLCHGFGSSSKCYTHLYQVFFHNPSMINDTNLWTGH